MPTVNNWEEWDDVEDKAQNEMIREKINHKVKNQNKKEQNEKTNLGEPTISPSPNFHRQTKTILMGRRHSIILYMEVIFRRNPEPSLFIYLLSCKKNHTLRDKGQIPSDAQPLTKSTGIWIIPSKTKQT